MILKSNKHIGMGRDRKIQAIWLKKRLSHFAPDFSLESDTVNRLTKSIENVQKCEDRVPTPGFSIGQAVVNKTLEIVQQEIVNKTTLRNYSALGVPERRKMELQLLNDSNGVTQYEQARMAFKLLINYGKNQRVKAKRKFQQQEEIHERNAILTQRLNSSNLDQYIQTANQIPETVSKREKKRSVSSKSPKEDGQTCSVNLLLGNDF